jgi:hypothetical protein
MTPAEAILSVLGPIATFIGGLAVLFLKRHFRHLDVVEKRLEDGGKIDAEVAIELRLSREHRMVVLEKHEGMLVDATRERAQLFAELALLKQAIHDKLDDQRHKEIQDSFKEHAGLIAGRVSLNPGDLPLVRAPEPPPAPAPPRSRKSGNV